MSISSGNAVYYGTATVQPYNNYIMSKVVSTFVMKL